MQKFECLEHIIGVTKDFCQCLHGQISQEEFEKNAISNSGLYLDDVEGGLMLRTIQRVDRCKSFYELQVQAIEQAKKFFVADILAMLNLKYQVKKTNFIGDIGRPTFTGSLSVSKRLQFLRLTPKTDGVLHLQRMRVFLNKDIETKVWIMRIAEGETSGLTVYENESVVSSGSILSVEFPEALSLPLKINGKDQEYYFIYEKLDSTLQPRDIKCSCGCSGGDAFQDFLTVQGGEAEMFSEVSTSNFDGYTHGVSLDVQIKCEAGAVICKQYDENDAVSYVTAFAILYKAAEIVMENVKASNEVNRYTLLQGDELRNRRSHFKKEYNDRIKYLSDVIDIASSDCFICREDTMYLGNILN